MRPRPALFPGQGVLGLFPSYLHKPSLKRQCNLVPRELRATDQITVERQVRLRMGGRAEQSYCRLPVTRTHSTQHASGTIHLLNPETPDDPRMPRKAGQPCVRLDADTCGISGKICPQNSQSEHQGCKVTFAAAQEAVPEGDCTTTST